MNLQKYNKAFVPVGVTIVLFALAQIGVTREMKIEDVVTLLVTSGVVWLVPNKT